MPGGPALLVVGHPGHELRVHGWLESARPVVDVITDGSGHTGASRLPSTSSLIAGAGATRGGIYGRFTDVEVYNFLLTHQTGVFVRLAEELATYLIRNRVTLVVGDDAEGYNPTHDICRMVIDAAVEMAQPAMGGRIINLAFLLMDQPDRVAPRTNGPSSQVTLDDDALARKMAAAAGYSEMAAEVAYARKTWGDEAFRVEAFRHVAPGELWMPMAEAPFYERYGSKRVEAGAYAEVIRYDQHVRPLADALAKRALRRAS